MVDNQLTRSLFENKQITHVYTIAWNDKGTFSGFKCKVIKTFKDGKAFIIKLKTGKDYPLGHKYIYRSVEEVI